MFTVLREDTANYGFVVSQHSTFAAAETAINKKAASIMRLSPNAQAFQMYRLCELPRTPVGTRVRFPSD
jgi:hypothetical protein